MNERHRDGFVVARPEPLPQRERELDAAGAATDDDDSKARSGLAVFDSLGESVGATHQIGDRAGRQRVLADPGKLESGDGGADVDRGDIVADGWTVGEVDELLVGVDPGRRRHDDARHRAARERDDVDLELVGTVLPGDEARDHPRVHRHGTVDDNGHVSRRRGLHGEAADHLDVGVAAPHEDELRLRPGAVGRRQSALL